MTTAVSDDLERAWRTHVGDDTSLLDRLVTRHRERQRRYHRIEHVEAVLAHVVDLAAAEPVADLGAVVAAAFYHDAIYEPTHRANERASARLARRDLARLGWTEARIDAVAAMIEATATHADTGNRGTGNRDTGNRDTGVLLDADLAILGADPEAYRRYAAQVREEYGHLDDGEWAAGRSQVLRALLARDAIYTTESGRRRWETAARDNITAELATMSARSSSP